MSIPNPILPVAFTLCCVHCTIARLVSAAARVWKVILYSYPAKPALTSCASAEHQLAVAPPQGPGTAVAPPQGPGTAVAAQGDGAAGRAQPRVLAGCIGAGCAASAQPGPASAAPAGPAIC